MTYGVGVKFKSISGGWSPAIYTYLSDKEIKAGTNVVVPTNDYMSVGQVVICKINPKLKPEIKYRKIIQVVEICDN